MKMIDLGGRWSVSQKGSEERIPATVPGCVHTDLLSAGLLKDPFYRDRELDTQWVGETDWTYERLFDVPSTLLENDRILLRCEGLDTLASIRINNRVVGQTDNMHRAWEFDVKALLRAGENQIAVRFDSPFPYLAKKQKERKVYAWSESDGASWLRKEACNFGWDWGPRLVTCGVWRDIEIVAFSEARLDDVRITQTHKQRGGVDLEVAIGAERSSRGALSAVARVTYEGEVVAEVETALRGAKGTASATVKDPKLWWPNDMGEQPLYEVRVELRNAKGDILDVTSKRIGLRTLRLERKRDEWGESFQFVVNGVAFFAKGANWIPADVFATRVARADYERLLGDAASAHMNMIRVWGGGIYEQDIFYDLCDELGLCVWQDFMFACATVPSFDADFMANVEAEASDNVRRLRHHPSVALWCGNNELEQGLVGDEWNETQMDWEDYGKLFDKLLPAVVRRCDPERDYWPGSPHTPRGERRSSNDPNSGDAHLWGVWHERKPFEWYRECRHRFNSEFGFQSFPEPKTVRDFTLPGDRNVASPIMEHHQKSVIGNSAIFQQMLEWFRMPKDFETQLWLSQTLQGLAIQYAVEHWRRSMPRGMGTLYWQMNDCWPVASWSSIDSAGRWKALHYMARRFFAPVLVSGLEDAEKGTVEVHVTSDRLEATRAELSFAVTDIEGGLLKSGTKSIRVAPRKSVRAQTLRLAPLLKPCGADNLLIWLELKTPEGETLSTNLVTFVRPKRMELQNPEVSIKAEPNEKKDGFRLLLSAEKPALWAWLELSKTDARLSDNFFHLRPGNPVEVTLTPSEPMTLEAMEKQLRLRSLVDTF